MNNKKIIYALAFLVLSIFLINNAMASSFYAPSDEAAECSTHGDVTINLQSISVMYLKDLLVEAKYSSEPSYSKVDGLWYDKENNLLNFLQSDEKVVFRSLGSYFNRAGTYSIRVKHKDLYEEIEVTCPEFKFSCNDIKIDVQECYSEGDDFIIVFLGKGLESQKTKLDLEKDVYYTIESQRQSWIYDNLPMNVSFEKLENETYKMTFPRNKDYPVEDNLLRMVEIGVKENLETISFLGSGCNGGENNKVYPNARDLETKCPTKVEIVEEEKEAVIPKEAEETDKEEEEFEITGRIIGGEEEEYLTSPAVVAGIIGFVIGITITFVFMNRNK